MESKDRQEHAAAGQAVGDAPPLVLGNRSEEKAPAGKGKMELPPTSWDVPLDPESLYILWPWGTIPAK